MGKLTVVGIKALSRLPPAKSKSSGSWRPFGRQPILLRSVVDMSSRARSPISQSRCRLTRTPSPPFIIY